jgi:hypothetical protein
MVPDALFPDELQVLQTAPFPRDFRQIETEIGQSAIKPVPYSEKIHLMREGHAWR